MKKEIAEKSVWTPEAIRQAIVDAVTEIQAVGGNEVPEFADDLCLLLEVPRFDSLTAVELITVLSEKFDLDLPDDLLYDLESGEPLRLGQIVERIAQSLNDPRGGKTDEHGE